MVLPTDSASWNAYATVRSTGTEPIALKAAGTAVDAGAAADVRNVKILLAAVVRSLDGR